MENRTLKELHHLRGLKARHIPYELTDGRWQQNPEHEERVTLLEYFYGLEHYDPQILSTEIKVEGILFVRSDFSLGRDRLDSFTIIPE